MRSRGSRVRFARQNLRFLFLFPFVLLMSLSNRDTKRFANPHIECGFVRKAPLCFCLGRCVRTK